MAWWLLAMAAEAQEELRENREKRRYRRRHGIPEYKKELTATLADLVMLEHEEEL
jgi:hypothetical protein